MVRKTHLTIGSYLHCCCIDLFKNRKNLPNELFEWQFADPKSATARRGFRQGIAAL